MADEEEGWGLERETVRSEKERDCESLGICICVPPVARQRVGPISLGIAPRACTILSKLLLLLPAPPPAPLSLALCDTVYTPPSPSIFRAPLPSLMAMLLFMHST